MENESDFTIRLEADWLAEYTSNLKVKGIDRMAGSLYIWIELANGEMAHLYVTHGKEEIEDKLERWDDFYFPPKVLGFDI
jgi:hypothetical protein